MIAMPLTAPTTLTSKTTTLLPESNACPAPLSRRVTACAVLDGVYDLREWTIYLPVDGRRRGVTQRILKGTLRRNKDGRITAYVFDDRTDNLSFIYMSASQPLALV